MQTFTSSLPWIQRRIRLISILGSGLMSFWCHDGYAQLDAGVVFLRIQPNVRSQGMGGASVALAENALPQATNPAALAFHKKFSFYAGGGEWLPDFNLGLSYYCGGIAGHIENFGTVGLAVRRLSFGEYFRHDRFGNELHSFNSYDLAITGSFGLDIGQHFAVGFGTSIIRSRLADMGAGSELSSASATAVAFDMGLLIHDIGSQLTIAPAWDEIGWLGIPHTRGLTFGIALQNIGPDINYSEAEQSDPLPRNLAVGVSYRPVDLEGFGLTLAADINHSLVRSDSYSSGAIINAGVEISLARVIELRGGYIHDEIGEIKTPTLGVALGPERYRLECSYIPESEDMPLSRTTLFSLIVRLE